ncbi:MAG TPA: hypothetical protein VMT53_03940 [Terriglobales bacterium]|nr:hypothetical protein [Terriglobales bacterium]
MSLRSGFGKRNHYFRTDWQICDSKQVHSTATYLYAKSVNTSATIRYLNRSIKPVPFPAATVRLCEQRQSKRHSDRVTIAQVLQDADITGVQQRQAGAGQRT